MQLHNNTSTSTNVFDIQHGYDRDSNRLYAKNTTQGSASHVYTMDNLNRLSSDKKGQINTGNTRFDKEFDALGTISAGPDDYSLRQVYPWNVPALIYDRCRRASARLLHLINEFQAFHRPTYQLNWRKAPWPQELELENVHATTLLFVGTCGIRDFGDRMDLQPGVFCTESRVTYLRSMGSKWLMEPGSTSN